MHQCACIADVGAKPIRVAAIFIIDGLEVKRFFAKDLRHDAVLVFQHGLQFRRESLLVHPADDADADTIRCVRVARADAAARRTDLRVSLEFLLQRVETLVVRHDDMRPVGNPQRADFLVLGCHAVQFVQKLLRIENDIVADDACAARIKDARRQQMQFEFMSVCDNRMACIAAALITRYYICLRGKIIHNLALPFVAPLGADYND